MHYNITNKKEWSDKVWYDLIYALWYILDKGPLVFFFIFFNYSKNCKKDYSIGTYILHITHNLILFAHIKEAHDQSVQFV